MATKFYAVKVGKVPGIYTNWNECKAQVDGFSGAIYKSFPSASEAAQYMGFTSEVKENCRNENENVQVKNLENLSDEEAVAYVDGSFNVVTGEFSYGVVMFHKGQEMHFNKKYEDKELAAMRNVAGEIKGSEAAMKYAMENGIKTLYIYHDYEGISRWPLKEWKANKEGTISYRNYYDSISKHVDIRFIKVKGHSGDRYNDEADRLAKEALGL